MTTLVNRPLRDKTRNMNKNITFIIGLLLWAGTAIGQEPHDWQDVPFDESIVTQKIEKQIFRDPVIMTKKVPITGQ